MRTMKLPVLFLVLVARLCRAEVVIASLTPDRPISNLVEDLVNIVTSCYGDRIYAIGLAGDLPDTLLRTLSTRHSIPVALIDNTMKSKYPTDWVPVKIRHKLPIFIVKVSSVRQLKLVIESKIKQSIWWNYIASFFILDGSPGCERSVEYLLAAWELDLLNAKVMCYGDKSERTIKNYNPFTSLAPIPWRKAEIVAGKNRHPFTVFVRESRGNEKICSNLDFNKMKDLGGYQISVEGMRPMRDIIIKKNGRSFYEYWMTIEIILHNVYRATNVTPIYSGSYRAKLYGDMQKNAAWIQFTWITTTTAYPHDRTGFVLVSQFRGNKSQLQKILGVIDTNSHIGLGIVYFLTLIFFKYVIHQALVPAVLNLIRITCGMGFDNIPHSHPPRIYLTGILFFAITMHGIFEGNLASLLTTVIPLRNVNTLQDLLDFNYTIYGIDTSKGIIDDTKLQKNFIAIKNINDCIRRVRDDESSACIYFAVGNTLDRAREFNLHVSKGFVTPTYLAFPIRWYWPAEERFNTLLSRLVEADVMKPWDVQCNPTKLEYFQMDQDVKNNKDFKNIEFGELKFAFVLLGVGLVLATFIIEIHINYR